MTFTGAETLAVIIGIEDYEISRRLAKADRWDLDGPASDAVRFANWLTSRNVPPANIHVFQSALDPAARVREFEDLGIVHLHDATQHALETFFRVDLPDLSRTQPGQLFVLWGGHGILRAGLEQHLFCQDVNPQAVLTVYLRDLLLRLAQMTGFSRQFIFVDACSNAHEDTGLGKPSFYVEAEGKRPSGVEQYALLAASAGQLAANQRDEHAGLFSSFLFAALHSKEGWPAFAELEKTILGRFDEKSEADATFNQRPVSITFTDHTNHSLTRNYGGTPVPSSLQAIAQATGYSVGQLQRLALAAVRSQSLGTAEGRGHFYTTLGFPAPPFSQQHEYDRFNLLGRVLLENKCESFLDELRAREAELAAYGELRLAFQQAVLARDARHELRGCGLSISEYRQLFSLLLSDKEVSSLDEMLDLLATRGLLGSSAIFDFFFRVADCPKCATGNRLRDWVKGHADDTYYAELEQRWAQSRSYTVVVSVKPFPGTEETPESFTVWLLENGRVTGTTWREKLEGGDDLHRRLEASMEKALAAATGPALVEIAIPMALMRMNFHLLGTKPPSAPFKRMFGRDRPVLIRWRDRQKPHSIWGYPWQAAAASIRANLASNNARVYELPPQPDEAFVDGLENPPGEFLYMSSASVPVREGDPDWLHGVIVAGVPFAGWMATPVNETGVPAPLDQLQAKEFDELPRRVVDARRGAVGSVLRSLILLWDDPERRHTVLLDEPA